MFSDSAGAMQVNGWGICNTTQVTINTANGGNSVGVKTINQNIVFTLSNGSSVYVDNGKVYPLSLALNFIIKA